MYFIYAPRNVETSCSPAGGPAIQKRTETTPGRGLMAVRAPHPAGAPGRRKYADVGKWEKPQGKRCAPTGVRRLLPGTCSGRVALQVRVLPSAPRLFLCCFLVRASTRKKAGWSVAIRRRRRRPGAQNTWGIEGRAPAPHLCGIWSQARRSIRARPCGRFDSALPHH